ncbi:lytic polysaccharide monooxygenase [Cryptosporangium japonicum]|uniref:Chitin-binding type-3 domain-containing protein n=1 Tax=Cryptosporangium japonicum TaxID=80872 RepID=A0ABP3EWH5_9ACTN
MDGRARSTSSIQPSARGSHRRAARGPTELTSDLTKLIARAAAVATPPPPAPAPVVGPGRHHADAPPPPEEPPSPRFRPTRLHLIAAGAVASVAVVVVSSLLVIWPSGEDAAGTTTTPSSRGYTCRPGNRFSEAFTACRAAAKVRPANGDEPAVGLGDGTDIGVADVGDRHHEVIPDTRLCSAGRERYRGLDLARDDWPVTTLKSRGKETFVYRMDGEHDGVLRFYLTKAGYDPTAPLTWNSLEKKPLAEVTGKSGADNYYRVPVTLPERSGRHLVYTIWEDRDSDAALYACSDVMFGAPTGGATTNAANTAPSAATATREWVVGVDYQVGDQVVHDDVTYRCSQPHRSVRGWEPESAPALWDVVTP